MGLGFWGVLGPGSDKPCMLNYNSCLSNAYERVSEKRVLKAFQQLLHNRHLKNA